MKRACLCLLAAILVSAKDNTISQTDAADGWILLFDGASTFGWTQSRPGAWRIAAGALVFDGQQSSLLGTSVPFSDFELRFEFKSTTGPSPDLLLRYASAETPADEGYVVKLSGGSAAWPVGSIVSVARSDLPPPALNQWHRVEIECSGDTLNVSIDGRKAVSGKDPRSKAGLLGFDGKAGGSIQLRNLRLKPYSMQALFNGSDLANWRAVSPPPPKPTAGLKKMLKLGGGKSKEAQWTVQQKSIHAEGGSGELQSQSLHDDFILQFQARVENRKGSESAVRVRADAGQFATGYSVGVDAAHTGSLLGFAAARPSVPAAGDFAVETVAVAGRHFVVWVNGYPASEFDDTRPEAASVQKGAKSAAGPIAISTSNVLDMRSVRSLDLPKARGFQKASTTAAAPSVAAPVTPTPLSAPVATPQPAAVSPAGSGALAQQQLDDAKTKAEVKRLTTQALQETDAQRQLQLYTAILELDPDNAFAANGRRDTKQKLDQAAEQEQKQAQQQAQESQRAASDQARGQDSLHNAQGAFAAGNVQAASKHLAIAKQLLPGNPEVAKLDLAISRVTQSRQRIKYLASGAGMIACVGAVVLLFRKRGKKVPVLMVMDGVEKGKRFLLNAEVNHIGAVAQDGSARNEIVLRDVDRMISRFHCEILNRNGRLFLLDCNSSNGTFVNGKRLAPRQPTRLKGGSRFSLAKACALQVGYEGGRKNKSA